MGVFCATSPTRLRCWDMPPIPLPSAAWVSGCRLFSSGRGASRAAKPPSVSAPSSSLPDSSAPLSAAGWATTCQELATGLSVVISHSDAHRSAVRVAGSHDELSFPLRDIHGRCATLPVLVHRPDQRGYHQSRHCQRARHRHCVERLRHSSARRRDIAADRRRVIGCILAAKGHYDPAGRGADRWIYMDLGCPRTGGLTRYALHLTRTSSDACNRCRIKADDLIDRSSAGCLLIAGYLRVPICKTTHGILFPGPYMQFVKRG